MMKNYFMRGMLLLGAVALAGGVASAEKGGWRNINHMVKNVSRCDGWSGVITGAGANLGEFFPGAGLTYQVLQDMPEGTYTLTLHALNRPCGAEFASHLYLDGQDVSRAYAFLGDTEERIPNLFDNPAATTDNIFDANGNYIGWDIIPNSLDAARAAFDAGLYEVTVLYAHKGGDLKFGIRNYGFTTGNYGNGQAEWTCFGDFKLVGPDGDLTDLIKNPTFIKTEDEGWNIQNIDNSAKGRGNHNGCVFSKTNASPYNFGQTLYDMPAGKYRFVINAFNNDFLGHTHGVYVPMKGAYYLIEGESALDIYVAGSDIPRGTCNSPDYVPTGYLSPEACYAYVYMNEGEKDCGWLEDNLNPWLEDGVVNGKQTVIKNLFEEDLDEYVWTNQTPDHDGFYQYSWVDENGNVQPEWYESGTEINSAAIFVNHPELYVNIVEMEFTGNSNTFTIGTRKDVNQNNYWQPSADWRLEYWDPEYEYGSGEDGIADLTNDENAPVEYFNLQGVRVATPENGLYIVKQGKTVSKKVF